MTARFSYIALIRGINVGGSSVIKMDDLRKLFESKGFADVTSYIQSGNVLFSTDSADREKLTARFERRLSPSLGSQVRVFLMTSAELERASACNPFGPEEKDPENRCHLFFMSARPEAAREKALMALQGKEYRFHIHDRVLYYAYPRKLVVRRRTIDLEKVLGVTGTSRSRGVVAKLIELSRR